ncbi:MAG: energy-coupling factor ABC transporter permease [Betaproteobacteria bacterium]|nr:energy-coupling factor ABC transporter permease [Betaproteobacteria bacterium]
MHMADALLSPAVGGALWAASAASLAWSARRVRAEGDDGKVPLMGVLGAFLFAVQMINFAIPGTGSSGHLGGGLLLAILLGPAAALLVVASVLVVQALFFADGGLLALGCNIFNLGFLPAFVAYPLVYRPLAPAHAGSSRRTLAAVVAAVVGLQLGAVAVVAQTVASGVAALPWPTFAAFMLPIHLAIGVVEGIVTALIVSFLRDARPEVLPPAGRGPGWRRRGVAAALVLALLAAGVLSQFASDAPDGLEWSIARVAGHAEAAVPATATHAALAALQASTALLPDYGFARAADAPPDARGTSVAGLVGGALTLVVALGLAWVVRRRGPRR